MKDLPALTTEQMREVDRAMIEDYHVDLAQMMENAGYHLAALARQRFLGGDPRGKALVVLAGAGGNGGGGLVAARRLHGWGAEVHVLASRPDSTFRGVPADQLDIIRRLGVPVDNHEDLEPPSSRGGSLEGRDPVVARPALVIDALIGYGLAGAPRGAPAHFIRWADGLGAPILSLDTPSGLDTTTGQAYDPTIRATATMALALPKLGLQAPGADRFVGELYVADIGVPPDLYAGPRLGLEVPPLFARRDLVRVDHGDRDSGAVLRDEVAAMLQATAQEHHMAFLETDGEDSEWPTWYAAFLLAQLP